MAGNPRVAAAGDVCVLLRPMRRELVELRAQQRRLQREFGGQLEETVHLTCQRFRLERADRTSSVVRSVAEELAGVRSFPLLVSSLSLVEHPFWESRLLRWRVEPTVELRRFGRRLERALACEGVRPHFPSEQGWMPRYVTALVGARDRDVDQLRDRVSFPYRLFDARRVLFSRIEGRKRFRILAEILLGE